MNIPLLQQEKSTSSNLGFGSTRGAGQEKKAIGLFGAALLQKYEIKNEIIEKVKLPIALSQDFLEKSVAGVKYKQVEEEVSEIFDTTITGRLHNTEKVFDGIRTKQRTIMKEKNFASTMAEYNNILYLGCKDGTIHVIDAKDEKTPQKRFIPHHGKDVLSLQIADAFLLTLSVN